MSTEGDAAVHERAPRTANDSEAGIDDVDAALRSEVAALPTRRSDRLWSRLTGDDSFRRGTIATWALLIVVAAFVVQGTLRFDFRDEPIAGDQSTYLMQALSLSAPDHNMTYDGADMDRWRDVGWVPSPTSLFFQRSDDDWVFAKPFGYSAYLAVFIGLFGITGVAVGNSVLVLALASLVVATLRMRFRGPVVPLATISFVFASYAYMYGYPIHADLFLAVVTALMSYVALWAWRTRRLGLAIVAGALMAVTLPEKPQLIGLYLPIVVALVWRQRRVMSMFAVAIVAIVAFAVATAPYRTLSDGKAWNAYEGERYITSGSTPFDHPGLASKFECPPICPMTPEVSLTSIDGVRTRIEQGRGGFASAFYYFFGRHTGLLVFIPFSLMALVAAVCAYRRLDGLGWALLVGIGGYIALNVMVFPNNYYGGGQSLGDRYFLQVAPITVALLVAAKIGDRVVLAISVASIVLGMLFLWPQHRDPAEAFIRIDRTSPLQRLLPLERNQDGVKFFRCPIYGDCSQTEQVIPGFRR